MEQIIDISDYNRIRSIKDEVEKIAFDFMRMEASHVQCGLGYIWTKDQIIVRYLHEGGSECDYYIPIEKILKFIKEQNHR